MGKKKEKGKKINGTEHVSAPCPSRCSVRLISIRFSSVAMVNVMQKRKKSRRGRVDVRESNDEIRVGALFGRDKRHSRTMTVTKPRNYYFRYSCVSPFEKVRFAIRCPETQRFSIVSFSRYERKLLLEDV